MSGSSRPRRSRRAGRSVLAVAAMVISVAGFAGLGAFTAMAQSYPGPPAGSTPAPQRAAVERDKLVVAVVTGASGSVATDVLAPFEVFSRSAGFAVSTVAASRQPVVLSGGVHLVPDHTFDDLGWRPDVVVVPAVAQPRGDREAPLRTWVAQQATRGARIMGVCAGAEVLAASGLLDGRRATTHWSLISSLSRSFPGTDWESGRRYVEDGRVITTAGVTSGVAGALRMMELLVGSEEADRVGRSLGFPGWSPEGEATIPTHGWELADLPFALNTAVPWFRPTIGLAVGDGIGEIDLAAAADLHSGGSFAARTVLVGGRSTVTTRHGLLLVVPPAGATRTRLDVVIVPGAGRRADLDPQLLE